MAKKAKGRPLERWGYGWLRFPKTAAPQDRPRNSDEAEGVSMTRCFACGRENYCMAVSAGVCAWCGYDSNKDAELFASMKESYDPEHPEYGYRKEIVP